MKVSAAAACAIFANFVLIAKTKAATETLDFCQSETFQPRCQTGEAVIIIKAIYGRMSHDSRCLEQEEELPSLRDDPKYIGCFEDVLHLVSGRCSGESDCEIRIPDPEMDTTNPCYKNMVKYLSVDYRCISVTQSDRSCQVSVSSDKVFLTPLLSNSGSGDVVCGSRERPWQLEAPAGQRINITLLDFTGSSSTSTYRPRTVETASSGCVRQFGFIEDKSSRRKINICTDEIHRQRTLYVSHSNQLNIVLTHTAQQTTGNFLISVNAVGCSDLVPPSDAWLKRSDNMATVGCYMTRQTWILTCDHNGRWTGTFGNCTQQLMAINEFSDIKVRPAESKQSEDDIKVIILVAIIGASSLVCIVIICVGVTWLCRLKGRKPQGDKYRDDDLLTSLDVKCDAAHHPVAFQ